MTKKERVHYWVESAEDDWTVARHLFEKGDYAYSLFFGHLAVEKLLKANYAAEFDETPPYTHRLAYLAEKASLDLTEEQLGLLETITDFNLEARYPDEKFSFKKRCTREFAHEWLEKIEEIKKWLLRLIQS